MGLQYLVLSLNQNQECFEFEFPDIGDEYLLAETYFDNPDEPLLKFAQAIEMYELKSDYYIGLINGRIGNNWFWAQKGNFGIITTNDWKKYYSPPSVLEYVITSIASLLIVMSDKSDAIKTHTHTRGCNLDFNRNKDEERVCTALGYICDECKSKIKYNLGNEYLSCFEKLISMEWLGDADELHSVANNLKKYFRIDLNKDTGYNKTRREKASEYLEGLPKEIISVILSTGIGIIIGFVLAQILGT